MAQHAAIPAAIEPVRCPRPLDRPAPPYPPGGRDHGRARAALDRAGRHDGRRQIDHRPAAGGAARLPFLDADTEIEAAAGMSISDIFATHGEPYFRDGEARVIARLLDSGPAVLATGGGAFMREETRDRIRDKAVSIWLKADADVIMKRVQAPRRPAAAADRRSRRDHRAPDRGALSGLSARRPHDLVARRAARKDRRRMYRGAARPAVRAAPSARIDTR